MVKLDGTYRKFVPIEPEIESRINEIFLEVGTYFNLQNINPEKCLKILNILITFAQFIGCSIKGVEASAFTIEGTPLTVFAATNLKSDGGFEIYVAMKTIVYNMIRIITHELGHVYMVSSFEDWSEDMATLTGFAIFIRLFKDKEDIISKEEIKRLIDSFSTLGVLTDGYLGASGEEANSRMMQYASEQKEHRLDSKYQEFLKKEVEFRKTF